MKSSVLSVFHELEFVPVKESSNYFDKNTLKFKK